MEIDNDVLARARAAAETIAPEVERIEAARTLTPPAVDALIGAGIFKLCVPRIYGGAQANAATVLAVIEELARLDGSVGWCAMIGATSGLMSLYLDDAVAREVYGPADAVSCGVFAPMGRAVIDGESVRVSGRWPFASGCLHSRWRMGGALGDNNEILSVLFRAEETTVHDTWHTAGLCGTGSHDFEVRDVVVPRARTFSLLEPRGLPFFGVLASGVAAVGLGVARAALDSFIHMATHKRPAGAKKTLAHRELVQLEVARGEARLRAARGLIYDSLAEATDSPISRARLRLAACHAASEAAAVAAAAYEQGGGAAIYRTHALQRHFRDAHAVTHHIMVGSGAMTTAGRVLLGVETDTSTL